MSNRAPSGSAPHPGSPGNETGRRRSISVVAATSGPHRATTLIGRRCGGGALQRPIASEGRRRQNPVAVSVAVAVAETVEGNPANPNLPALSRKRPTDFNVSDGQAGSPPPQCPPNRFDFEPATGHARDRAPSGCRVRHCAGSTLRHAVRPAQCRTGLPREERWGLLLRLRGRPPAFQRRGRRPPNPPPARPRRWCDAGSPEAAQKAGAERTPRPNTRSVNDGDEFFEAALSIDGRHDRECRRDLGSEECEMWHHALRPGSVDVLTDHICFVAESHLTLDAAARGRIPRGERAGT